MAQLVARWAGGPEAAGSSPASLTTKKKRRDLVNKKYVGLVVGLVAVIGFGIGFGLAYNLNNNTGDQESESLNEVTQVADDDNSTILEAEPAEDIYYTARLEKSGLAFDYPEEGWDIVNDYDSVSGSDYYWHEAYLARQTEGLELSLISSSPQVGGGCDPTEVKDYQFSQVGDSSLLDIDGGEIYVAEITNSDDYWQLALVSVSRYRPGSLHQSCPNTFFPEIVFYNFPNITGENKPSALMINSSKEEILVPSKTVRNQAIKILESLRLE